MWISVLISLCLCLAVESSAWYDGWPHQTAPESQPDGWPHQTAPESQPIFSPYRGTSDEKTTSPPTNTDEAGRPPLTKSVLREIKQALLDMPGGLPPVVVRLSFHDCVGGCNGCINLNNKDNKGLEKIVKNLEELYKKNKLDKILSRADLWAYAGKCAVEYATRRSEPNAILPVIKFQYGRIDCPSAPDYLEMVNLPGPNLDSKGMEDYWRSEFNFTPREFTCLMGVHTLGRTHKANSGYRGAWVPSGHLDFNNRYYADLINSKWLQRDEKKGDQKFQWNAGYAMMLNSDMALYKDIDLCPLGKSHCSYDQCPAAPTAPIVKEYANSNALWVREFGPVFTKMINHKCYNLRDVEEW